MEILIYARYHKICVSQIESSRSVYVHAVWTAHGYTQHTMNETRKNILAHVLAQVQFITSFVLEGVELKWRDLPVRPYLTEFNYERF